MAPANTGLLQLGQTRETLALWSKSRSSSGALVNIPFILVGQFFK